MAVSADAPVEASLDREHAQRWRAMFVAAAVWNIVGAVMGLVFLEPLARIAWPGSALLADPVSVQFAMMVFGLIGVLSIGYGLLAVDPSRNRGLVLTAAIGKSVVLAFGVYYSWGVGTAWLLIPALGVAAFTSAFWWFLISTREAGWY